MKKSPLKVFDDKDNLTVTNNGVNGAGNNTSVNYNNKN